jgi:hypothetical protein
VKAILDMGRHSICLRRATQEACRAVDAVIRLFDCKSRSLIAAKLPGRVAGID